METFTLAEYNHRLCVASTISSFSKPVLVTHYWPIGSQCLEDWREFLGHNLVRCDPGTYCLDFSDIVKPFSWLRQCSFILTESGATESIHREIQDYPCPKVRKGVET